MIFLGELHHFPNNGEAYIRRAIQAYDAYDIEKMLKEFKKGLEFLDDLEDFQNLVLNIFEENGYYAEMIQIIMTMAELGENPTRIASLMSRFDDDDMEEFADFDLIEGMNELPDDVENFILHGTEVIAETDQATKNANNALKALEMAENLIDNKQSLTPQEQLDLLDRISMLPEDMGYNLLLNLIYGNTDFIFQTDLILAFKNLVDEETIIQIPDMHDKHQKIDINSVPPLMKHEFYTTGLKNIREQYFKDPIFQEVLINEWVLICSYIYPFFNEFKETPEELVIELFSIVTGEADELNSKTKSFNLLNKVRAKIFKYQQNL